MQRWRRCSSAVRASRQFTVRPARAALTPSLVGAGEDVRDVGGEKDRYGDDGERHQGHTHHELHQLVAVFLLPLLFIHTPINAQRSGDGSPSYGGSGLTC